MSVVRKRGGKHSYYIDLGVTNEESVQKEKGDFATKKIQEKSICLSSG